MSMVDKTYLELLKRKRRKRIRKTIGVSLCVLILCVTFLGTAYVMGINYALILVGLATIVSVLDVLIKWLLD